MIEHSDRRQSWFGLVTTLICIVVLFALIAPAVQDTDRRRRRSECELRLKDLALATINFDTSKKCYPTYQAEFGQTNGRSKLGSWVVSLLPYLEKQDLRDKWDDPSEQDNWLKAVVQQDRTQLARFYPKLDLFTCPKDQSLKGKYAPRLMQTSMTRTGRAFRSVFKMDFSQTVCPLLFSIQRLAAKSRLLDPLFKSTIRKRCEMVCQTPLLFSKIATT